MFEALKNLWRYLKNYKGLLLGAIISILIAQALLLVSPLLVKSLIDDHIVGIEQPFSRVEKNQEYAVNYNGNYYVQNKHLPVKEVAQNNQEMLQVVGLKKGFYVVEESIAQGSRILTDDGKQLIVKDNGKEQRYETTKLTKDEVVAFYAPAVKPMMILILLIFVRGVLSAIVGYAQRMATAYITINITKDARMAAVEGLHRLSIDELAQEPAGKTSARVIHDVAGLMTLFSVVINIFFNATIGLIFTYIGMFYLNATLAIITFIVFPIIYFWLRYFSKRIYDIASRTAEINSLLISNVNEVINGISILQAFNRRTQTREKYNELSDEFVDKQMEEIKFHLGIGWNSIRLFKNVLSALVLTYFAWFVLGPKNGVVLAGTIYAYIDYLDRMLDPLDLLFVEFGNLQHSIVKTNRVFKLIDANTEKIDKEYIPRFDGSIAFKNVTFSYDGEHTVLNDINLDITSGQMIGLVGHTGSGKSSMMNLLMRFYDLKETDQGEILIDGKNIAHYSKQTYRQHVGIILQEATLFAGTIADNIRFGKEGILDRDVEKVFRSIGGSRIIDKFENGIHQQISRSGSNLSVGEKQMIAFARALIYDPSVLIMDEATANMDTETEKMIQHALSLIAKDRTTIVIAHRLSTIRDADKIVVLENGQMMEEGTHLELLTNDGIYANMYRQQS